MDKTSTYSIYTQPPIRRSNGQTPGKRRLNKKWLAWAGIVTLVLVLGASVTWGMRWYSHRKLLASIKEDPRQAFEAAREGKITREDARDIMREAFEQRMDAQMDAYFALPVGKQRDAFLDRLIDEQQARMREWQSRATTQPWFRDRSTTQPTTRPSDRNRGGDPVARMRSRIQSGNPSRSAQRAEFMAAMRQRMAERGIQPGRGGPGRWGGFGRGGGGGGANR